MANVYSGVSRQQSPYATNQVANHTANQNFRSSLLQNPSQVASWFGQQNGNMQGQILGAGQFGGNTSTPWGNVGNAQRAAWLSSALVNGGLNQNSMNQMINSNSNNGVNSSPNGIWDYTSGGSRYGPSSYDASGWDSAQPGITQTNQYNPTAWTGGQPATAVGGGNTPPIGGNNNPAGTISGNLGINNPNNYDAQAAGAYGSNYSPPPNYYASPSQTNSGTSTAPATNVTTDPVMGRHPQRIR